MSWMNVCPNYIFISPKFLVERRVLLRSGATMKLSMCLEFSLLALFLVQCKGQNDENDVIVDIEELGSIKGIRMNNTNGIFREYVRFTGIPYAKSPDGESRFLPADDDTGRLVPEGEFDATLEGNSCVQPGGFLFHNPESHSSTLEYLKTGNESIVKEYLKNEAREQNIQSYVGTEDCLNLNIHTPGVSGRLYPVIVFIHGGAFTSGNGILYGPGKLFRHDVVLVTINYRLGVLGFFSLETNEAPGNAALYDMLSALRWVQQYIHNFGGDPNLVTIMGQSAGAVGISQLLLSPLSSVPKPLFHRAIALSGSALLPWGTIDSPIRASLRIAELADCYTSGEVADHFEITRCMKLADPDSLVNALTIYQAEERQAGRLGVDAISPIVQKAGEIKFLAKKPMDILTDGEQMDVPLLMGCMRHDGSFPLGIVYNRFLNCPTCGQLQNNVTFLRTQLLPSLLRSMGVQDDTGAVYDALAFKYLGDRRDSGNFTIMTPGLIDIHSVFFFKAGAYKNFELHSFKNKDSYWYTFDHLGNNSLFQLLFPYPPPPIYGGVAHGDDVMYLFHFFTLNEVDQSVSDKLVDYYVNFAYNGNPNMPPLGIKKSEDFVEWPAHDPETHEYLVINKEFSIGNDYFGSWADASLELEPTLPTTPSEPETTEEGSTSEPETTEEGSTSEPETTEEGSTSEPETTEEGSTSEPETTEEGSTSEPETTEEGSTSEPETTEEGSTSEPETTNPPNQEGTTQAAGVRDFPTIILGPIFTLMIVLSC